MSLILAYVILTVIGYFACRYEAAIGLPLRDILLSLSGLIWMAIALKFGDFAKPIGITKFLSATSFEIYLTHHALCSGPLSVLYLTPYVVVNYLILWGLTIIFAYPLRIIGSWLNKNFFKI